MRVANIHIKRSGSAAYIEQRMKRRFIMLVTVGKTKRVTFPVISQRCFNLRTTERYTDCGISLFAYVMQRGTTHRQGELKRKIRHLRFFLGVKPIFHKNLICVRPIICAIGIGIVNDRSQCLSMRQFAQQMFCATCPTLQLVESIEAVVCFPCRTGVLIESRQSSARKYLEVITQSSHEQLVGVGAVIVFVLPLLLVAIGNLIDTVLTKSTVVFLIYRTLNHQMQGIVRIGDLEVLVQGDLTNDVIRATAVVIDCAANTILLQCR